LSGLGGSGSCVMGGWNWCSWLMVVAGIGGEIPAPRWKRTI
jgi:hypothetical protein